MKVDSLEKAIMVILRALEEADIDTIDKIELMINLNKLLDIKHYKHNIESLKDNATKRL